MSEFPFSDLIRNTENDKKSLATAGYGMTEGGVWIPRKVSDEGYDLTQLTGSNVEDENSIPTRTRKIETFVRHNVEVAANSFLQVVFWSTELNFGWYGDMTEYSHVYFGAQSFSGSHDFHLIIRQKPIGAEGSMIIDTESEKGMSTKLIGKTPIELHNLSPRIYNNSDEDHFYTVAIGFWPL